MRESGVGQVERLREEVVCPLCDYALRGLEGDRVTCPECGAAVDVAALVSNRWEGPWYGAPHFNAVLAPVAWLALSVLVIGTPVLGLTRGRPGLAGQVALVVIGGGWVLGLLRARRLVGQGVRLALFAHAILALYVAAVALGVWLVLLGIRPGADTALRLVALVLLVVPVAMLFLGRRGERLIGHRCIRHHLARTAGRAVVDAEGR